MPNLPQIPTISDREHSYAWVNIMVGEVAPHWRGEVAITGDFTRFEVPQSTANGFREAWKTATFVAIKKDVANFESDELQEANVDGWVAALRDIANRLERGDW